jgi:hypothetical protein
MQNMFEGYIFGKAPDLDQQTLPQLTATVQVAEWLRGLRLPGVPDLAEAQRRVGRESLLRPFRELVGQGFSGRGKELDRLREYVGFLDARTFFESTIRGAREFFDWHEKPPLVIHGPGGMGKSALIARFILDHLEPDYDTSERLRLPFVYLDFDRASLIPERPMTLLLEAGRQLSTEFQQLTGAWESLQALWSDELQQTTSGTMPNPQTLKSFRDLLAAGVPGKYIPGLEPRPLLFVLDTFEEVQYRGRDFVEVVFEFLSLLQRLAPRLRVVLAGRAPVKLTQFPTENYLLGPLTGGDAAQFLQQRGLDARLAARVADQVGGNPLNLRLALEVVSKEGLRGGRIDKLQTRNALHIRLADSQIQGQLYRRILGHIHQQDIAKLAHPGLVLRRITPELILEVLAEPCGVRVPDIDTARRLFQEMQREVSLVTVAEDGSLRHLPEVRRVMIDLLRKDDPAKVQVIQERAVEYYQQQPGSSAQAELVYHMLALGRPREELDEIWAPELGAFLGGALDELPSRSRAWLGPRLGVAVDDSSLAEADLEDWETYAVQRVRDLLGLGKPDVAISVLREREQRTYGSRLIVPQAQAQILTGDFQGAHNTIATGLQELQDPTSLLKLYVMMSWLDRLAGENLPNSEAVKELRQLNKRFGDDPRVLRFGLNRLDLVGDQWISGQLQDVMNEISMRVPDAQLHTYPLIGRELAIQLTRRHPRTLVRLTQLLGLGQTEGPAIDGLLSALWKWDAETGVLSRYRILPSPELSKKTGQRPDAPQILISFVRNLGMLADHEDGIPSQVYSALVRCFQEQVRNRSEQALYEELETGFFEAQARVAKPGVHRWLVMTGADPDAHLVGPPQGFVHATVEGLISLTRPSNMVSPDKVYPEYQNKRATPVELTIYGVEASIIALKLQRSGDYHLVLQGASGATMIAAAPNPDPLFVSPSSRWAKEIALVRQEISKRFVGGPGEPQRVRITGVGFFNRIHGQTGVAPNGIELHPVISIQSLEDPAAITASKEGPTAE